MPVVCGLNARMYAALLWLYPPAFRRAFGPEMRRDFDEACRDRWAAAGWRGLLRLWVSTGVDFMASLGRQWGRTSWQPLALVFTAVAVVAAASLADSAAQAVRTPSPAVAHPDTLNVAIVFLLVAVVLGLVSATIVFAWWSVHFSRRRTRGRRT
jgi:hypothetical protein